MTAFYGERWPSRWRSLSRRGFLFGLAAIPLSGAEESLASMERRVFDAINFQRISAYLDPLSWDRDLNQTAREHSRRMIEANYFGHHDPEQGDLSARLDHAGVPWMRCAENVFRERDYTDPVALSIVEWMYSKGHRENILTPDFTLTGVGAATDGQGTFALTQQFVVPFPSRSQRRAKNGAEK